jgi:hypothetical protein
MREHSTKHHPGASGHERHENYPKAHRGGPPLAAGRAAHTEMANYSFANFIATKDLVLAGAVRMRLRMPLLTQGPPNVGHERRL